MLGILVPVWGRPELSERVLAWWSAPAFDFCLRVAVVSPEDPNPSEIPSGWTVVQHENAMHGKLQAGLDAMRGRVDAVMRMDSDTLMTPGLVQLVYRSALDHGMACPSSLYTYDLGSRALLHAKYRRVYAGMAYSAEALERAGWDVFRPMGDLRADVCAAERCIGIAAPERLPRCHELGEAVVDIKSGENLWSFEYVARRATRRFSLPCEDAAGFFARHFPSFDIACCNR